MINLDKEFIENELAESLLNLTIGKSVNAATLMKSFYNFDFSTPESVVSFVALLPILDDEVIKQASAEIWPGSVDDKFNLRRARMELRGYLMDTLDMGLLADPDAEIEAAAQASAEIKYNDEAAEGEQYDTPGEEEQMSPGDSAEDGPVEEQE